MDWCAKLDKLQNFNSTEALSPGLDRKYIEQFLETDLDLRAAIDSAIESHQQLQDQGFSDFLKLEESKLLTTLQEGYLNFYDPFAVNPYVPLAAKGPWVVTTNGAVVHDSGGYGMLGFGHAPTKVLEAMNGDQVMANVMTASFSQYKLMKGLRKEIGFRRKNGTPFSQFVCINSGSESVTVALRISDVNAKLQTGAGGANESKKIVMMSQKGAFHGRTDRPSQASDSSLPNYQVCASFAARHNLITVTPNDKLGLANAFENAEKNGEFIECFLVEPVMGEGNPGVGLDPEFYALARKLTKQSNSLLICDSIQAGLRTHGCLSVVDYPGFETLEAPDMETYSKALNAGQYPLSVLALSERATKLYRKGIYGNTMTTNPRALDVACAVLESVTPAVRENIVDRGHEFVDKLSILAKKLDGKITAVTGTGLLLAAHLDKKRYKAAGENSVEVMLRRKGIGVIHGGENALRFTPHFNISSAEIDMIISSVEAALS